MEPDAIAVPTVPIVRVSPVLLAIIDVCPSPVPPAILTRELVHWLAVQADPPDLVELTNVVVLPEVATPEASMSSIEYEEVVSGGVVAKTPDRVSVVAVLLVI